jgi:hypothetical protein
MRLGSTKVVDSLGAVCGGGTAFWRVEAVVWVELAVSCASKEELATKPASETAQRQKRVFPERREGAE